MKKKFSRTLVVLMILAIITTAAVCFASENVGTVKVVQTQCRTTVFDPDTGRKLGTVPKGAVFEYLGHAHETPDHIIVRIGKVFGNISPKDLKLKNVNSFGESAVLKKTALRFRPGGKIITWVKKKSQVNVISNCSTWTFVIADGVGGYILGENLT